MWDSKFEPTPMRPDPKTARIAISFREPPLSAGENYLSDCDLTIRVAFTKMATKARVFNQLPSNLDTWFKLWNAINVSNFVVVYKCTKKQYNIDFRGVFFETPCIIYHLIIIGPCPGQRRVQPCITLENRLKNDRLMRTQTHTQTDRQTERGYNHDNRVIKEHNPVVNQSSVTSFKCMKSCYTRNYRY